MEAERDYVLDRPNRRKSSSKTTRAVVILLLVVTAVLMLVVTIFGWSKLQGALLVQVGYIVVYLVMAYYTFRWNRGVLPVAAALAIVLGIFAAVAGPAWFERDQDGFATADAIWGGTGLDSSILGLVTLLIIPVQVLLIAFAMRGFSQRWSVEVERLSDGSTRAVPAR